MEKPLLPDDPREVGGYALQARLGAGGQGVVYLGRAPDGTNVAVKVLHREWADGETRQRLVREISAARRVAPFCVAQVLDADVDADLPYIVSEYVEGPSLQQAGPRSGTALHRLAVSTATALAAVHEAGVVHRDFKPANVLLGSDGPRVIDFGIARHLDATTRSGGLVGTPTYMSPEQIAGAKATPASDVFAWGCVVVFAATGRPPFGDDSVPAVINRVMHREPDLGDLVEPLRSIVTDALCKDPARRPSILEIQMRLLGRPADEKAPAADAPPPATASAAPDAPPLPLPRAHADLSAAPSDTAPGPASRGRGTDGRTTVPPAGTNAGVVTAPGGHGARRRNALLAGTGAATLAVAVVVGVLLWQGAGNGDSREPTGGGDGTAALGTTGPEISDTTGSPTPPAPSASSDPPSPSPEISPTSGSGSDAKGTNGFPAGYAGVWRGRVDYDPGAYDRLVLTIKKGSRTATEQFLDYRCTGTSKLTGITDSIARLERTSMRGNCVRNGEIFLTLNDDGTLGFEYSGHGENKVTKDQPFFMHATLKRDR
ncbi:serine/threonine protein kinase [Microtetraspora fusca]|uniref:serine/threonine protein kinase n=1 Tax=Microtetraspora fusca TaxID=1997 RepID=UPI00083380FD|nr:serine/threonine-protein kinase [Microtetraspora fusca]